MQEFAPLKKTPPAGNCPSAEALAAYIDGNLEGAEKERITEHLASCEDCFETYAESVRFLLDSEPAPEENVVPFGRAAYASKDLGRRPRGWQIPAAAAALLVVGLGGGYLFFLASPPDLMTAELAEPIPAGPQVTGKLWHGPTFRGGGEGEEIPVDPASFQVGVQLVNLQVSLEAGNVLDSQNVIARILSLIKSQYTEEHPLYMDYLRVTGALEARKAPQEFLDDASRLSSESREWFFTDSLDLGQWVEAGRLAAIARDPSFFQQGTTRSFLRRLLWRDKVGLGEIRLDPQTRGALQEISRILDRGNLEPQDYAEMIAQFEKILEVQYPT